MNLKATSAAAAAFVLAAGAAQAQELNIPGKWQHQQNAGQQIFTAPGGAEGLSINPAPELARLGGALAVLDSVVAQFKGQYPTLKIMGRCQISPDTAVAFLQRPGPNGLVGERLQAGVGKGQATIMVFWTPSARFPAEHAKMFGGPPVCR